MNNEGTVAAMSAILAIPLVLSLGLAVDASSLWLLRQRMQWAVDTAALLAATQANVEPFDPVTNGASVTKDAQELFWLSYGAPQTSNSTPGPQVGFLGSSSAGATVTNDAGAGGGIPTRVTVQATASLPTFLMRVKGQAATTVTTSSTAAIPHRVEMAVVLDNSISMGFPAEQNGTTSKLASMQTAALNLVSTIMGTASSSSPNVSMAIVPFAGAVNVGNDDVGKSFLKKGTLNAEYLNNTTTELGWRGCVEARAYTAGTTSYDTLENDPASEETKFNPYFSPTTWHKSCQTYNGGSCVTWNQGDNDFPVDGNGRATSVTDTSDVAQTENTNMNYLPFYFDTSKLYFGPNLFCPRTSLVKLTNKTADLNNAINSMTLVNGGGTIINQGLQWGWFTVSPLWTEWLLPKSPTGANRPVAYNDHGTTKIVVLMTDGVSEVDGIDSSYGAAAGCPNNNKVYPECLQVDSWYTSYQRVSSGVLTTSGGDNNSRRSNAATELKTRLRTLCTNMKASDKGIVIYTVFFHGYYDDAYLNATKNGAGADLQFCASGADHYFDSRSSTAINTAFQTIAKSINDLRITQ